MTTTRLNLTSKIVRLMISVLIAFTSLLVTVLGASCGTSSFSPHDTDPGMIDSDSPTTSAIVSSATTTTTTTPTPHIDTITKPLTPTTTMPSGKPRTQNLGELMDALRPPIVPGKSIPFDARILRTPPLTSTVGISTNPVIIHNTKQLSTLLAKEQNGWQFSEDDVDNLLADYNREYFHKKILIVGVVGLHSGSIEVGIRDVIQSDKELTVLFNFEFPEMGTCDMMSWHYFVEISADDAADRTVADSYMPNVESPTLAY